MKDFFWIALLLLVLAGAELIEDCRGERCNATGGVWRNVKGWESDFCDRSGGAAK